MCFRSSKPDADQTGARRIAVSENWPMSRDGQGSGRHWARASSACCSSTASARRSAEARPTLTVSLSECDWRRAVWVWVSAHQPQIGFCRRGGRACPGRLHGRYRCFATSSQRAAAPGTAMVAITVRAWYQVSSTHYVVGTWMPVLQCYSAGSGLSQSQSQPDGRLTAIARSRASLLCGRHRRRARQSEHEIETGTGLLTPCKPEGP
jgi:hypothetical protein